MTGLFFFYSQGERLVGEDAARRNVFDEEVTGVLIEGCLAGDPVATNRLIERCMAYSYEYFRRYRLNFQDREDLSQDSLLRVYRNLSSFDRGRGTFKTWFTWIMEKIYQEFLRREYQRWGISHREYMKFQEELRKIDVRTVEGQIEVERLKDEFQKRMIEILNLDHKLDDGTEVVDLIVSPSPSPEESLENAQDMEKLEKDITELLTPQQRRVLQYDLELGYYDLDREGKELHNWNLMEAEGISIERLYVIRSEAMAKLKKSEKKL
jgi:RNA polymerase sigma factor (sigma-70 family)